MYAGKDFDAAEPDESEVFSFDFVNDLAPNETLVSTTWFITVVLGADSSPTSRLIGVPTINLSLSTGIATVASQRVSGLLNGVTYALKADVITTNANTKSLWARVAAAAYPMVA